MENNMLKEDEIVNKVAKVLDKIINENTKSLLKGDFWVNPGFGWGFYLNRPGGTFSLQSLTHHIMYETGIYQEILTQKQYNQCIYFIYEKPGDHYYPKDGSEEDSKLDDILMWVYFRCAVFVAHRLVTLGIDIKDYFEEFEDIDFKEYSGL